MMAVAIIGILASIIMVNLNAAKLKAGDASIMESAESIMKAAQVDSVATGDFNNYYANLNANDDYTISSALGCNSNFGQTSDPQSVRSACLSLYNNALASLNHSYLYAMTFVYPVLAFTAQYPTYLYIGPAMGNNTSTSLSIMVWLPGKQKYYCIGSDGGVSADTDSSGSGCGGNFECSGCMYDPNF